MTTWLVLLCLTGSAWAGPLDVNTSSAAALATLPGLGPDQANAIVSDRTQRGPFTSLEDLARVDGVGAATVATLRGKAVARASASHEAPGPPPPVDINQADATTLETLPGISADEATAIVADRNAHGLFTSCADLARVPGIGPATVAIIGERCTVPSP